MSAYFIDFAVKNLYNISTVSPANERADYTCRLWATIVIRRG